MRVVVTAVRVEPPAEPAWRVVVTGDAGTLVTRTMPACVVDDRWWPVPVDDDAESAVHAFIELSGRITGSGRAPSAADTIEYGRYLLEALLGDQDWDDLRNRLDTVEFPEIVLDFAAADTDLHRHCWELLHAPEEPATFLALDTERPVLILRRVAAPSRVLAARAVTEVPRMLFGVGSRLYDTQIRAGTEVMGVLRGHHQRSGLLDARVRPELTLNALAEQCREFAPHLVHLIGHGSWRPELGHCTFDLYADHGEARGVDGAEAVTGRQLAWALRCGDGGQRPLMVILSACDLGTSGPEAEEPAGEEGANAMAAELVAAGIPVVVAMTGQISHLACRDFARAFAGAILQGRPLARATAEARMVAAYRAGSAEERPLDWALPAIFVSSAVGDGFAVVDVARTERLRRFMANFGQVSRPAFYGRDEFFDLLSDLLNPRRDLAILLAEAAREQEQPGGTRLLHELATASLRAGRIPCVVGPFPKSLEPGNAAQFALEVVTAIAETRAHLELGAQFPSEVVRAVWDELPAEKRATIPTRVHGMTDLLARRLRELAGEVDPPGFVEDMGSQLRLDLLALMRDVHRRYPDLFTKDVGPIVLIDDLHLFGSPFDYLSKILTPAGVRAVLNDAEDNRCKIPVVMFTKDPAQRSDCVGSTLAQALLGTTHATTAELLLFPELAERRNDDCHYDAWRALLMHPSENDGELARTWTVRPTEEANWQKLAKKQYKSVGEAERTKVFSARLLHMIVENRGDVLEADNDEAVLAGWRTGAWSRP